MREVVRGGLWLMKSSRKPRLYPVHAVNEVQQRIREAGEKGPRYIITSKEDPVRAV